MANHRPKSLSELNNVYDKAMRAERAIKEGSDMLSTPSAETAPESENIFRQLENKAAEAQKSQVFDPDITNIANDFLKRYAQPEKPKAAPKEIKRPAPSIQIYHKPVKEQPEESGDVPLNMAESLADGIPPLEAPAHKPDPKMPETRVVKTEAKASEASDATQTVRLPVTPQVKESAVQKAPEAKQAPAIKHTPAKAQPHTAVDHTPRPAASRVRITSTERSELMEEYMRVMSDDDDEPSFKRPKFSFFKKKKKYEEDDTESSAELYEDLSEEDEYEDSAEEIPVVPFDSSDVKFTDEYSSSPASEDAAPDSEAMNLYDYIEEDFDYDEDAGDGYLDMSFGEEAEASEKIAPAEASEEATEEPAQSEEELTAEAEEYISEESEQQSAAEVPYEAAEDIYPAEAESESIPEETEDVIYPTEDTEEAEAVITPEEIAVNPTAGMVFEDIFSVSDENKRSHTGGNWNEFFGEEAAVDNAIENEEAQTIQEEVLSDEPEDAPSQEEEAVSADLQENEDVVPSDDGKRELVYERSVDDEIADDYSEEDYDDYSEANEEEEFEKPSKKAPLKILMALGIILCLAGAVIAAFVSATMDINSGNLFSEKYRAFTAHDTIEAFGISEGDLIITENIFAQTDNLFVYLSNDDGSYRIGKVTSNTSNLIGDYLYVTETKDGVQLINRDTSKGVITAVHSGVGTLMSVICDYGIFIAAALVIFAVALIICLAILIIKQRRYNEAAAIYDNPNKFRRNDDDSNDSSDDNEFYNDYDTDGIEQGLFNSI